uniref:Odorant receptor n=1 Tax=Trichogramma kaykai TaxID=54128 RepID=A0ABD2WKM2_9HYME
MIIQTVFTGLLAVTFEGYVFEPLVKFTVTQWLSANSSIERGLCVPIYFTNVLKNYYWICFSFTVIFATIMLLLINAMNFFQVITVKFIVGMLSVIGQDMTQMGGQLEFSSILLISKQKMKIVNKRILDNIRMHQEAIQLFEDVREVTRTKLLIIILFIILELSLAGFWLHVCLYVSLHPSSQPDVLARRIFYCYHKDLQLHLLCGLNSLPEIASPNELAKGETLDLGETPGQRPKNDPEAPVTLQRGPGRMRCSRSQMQCIENLLLYFNGKSVNIM